MTLLNSMARLNRALVERTDISEFKIFLSSTLPQTAPFISSQETLFRLLSEWNGPWMSSTIMEELHNSSIDSPVL